MSCSKPSPKKLTNCEIALQDMGDYLGVNYTFYQEFVIANPRAAARQVDASAWYE
jgi:hypothetical protein